MRTSLLNRRQFLGMAGASVLAAGLPRVKAVAEPTPKTPNIRRGVWPILVTPFTVSGQVDYGAIPELIEFYVQAGCAGVFAGGLSSEIFKLTLDEMVQIAQVSMKSAAGRIGIVATGSLGATLEEQASGLRRVGDTGVDASVILVSKLPSAEAVGDQLLKLAELAPGPLGLYECPVPDNHRIPVADFGRVAHSNRYFFIKDTSPEPEEFGKKVKAAEGSPLRMFNATLSRLPEMMQIGADGHCGTAAIVCPELTGQASQLEDPALSKRAHSVLMAINGEMVSTAYPSSGKYILEKRGLHLGTPSRDDSMGDLNDDVRHHLDALLKDFDFKSPSVKVG